MKAATHHRYGSPDVLELTEVEPPAIGDRQILVRVHASPVTQGDRRLRAADFPGISWLPGRLMMGLFRPKNPIPGTMFSGRVVAVGPSVTRFAVGDDVFGSCDHGAQAEYLAVPEDGAVARIPAGLGYDEAAAVPYGAVTALIFLRDLGRVRPGQKVLIVGASGGVGRFAVPIAKHLGAEVTGVCSGSNAELVRALGADRIIDYGAEDFRDDGRRYDVIFDTADASSFAACKPSLTREGRYLSLHAGVRVLFDMMVTSVIGGRRAIFGAAFGTAEDMEQVAALLEAGAIRPVIDRRYPLERIADAHARVETGRARGTVVVTVAPAEPLRIAA